MKIMQDLLQKIENWLSQPNSEENIVVSLISRIGSRDLNILDIGSGYGRYLKRLCAEGHRVTGVEKNPTLINLNRSSGHKCYSPDELCPDSEGYDLIVMSHIIEHFSPSDLLGFLNNYLKMLKPSGSLIIATPLMSNYFYDDFDHHKPYHPQGIAMILSPSTSQVQYRCDVNMALQEIWFRRAPLKINFSRSLFVKGLPIARLINLVSAFLFRGSLQIIGKADGWVALFTRSAD
jgi:SAM-dependent methyltransferase